jgi:outer membrane receptor protein involved in Fe transport
MRKFGYFALAAAATFATSAAAENFNIPSGDMKAALDAYAKQASVQLIYTDDVVAGTRSKGAKGDLSAVDALARILAGSGLAVHRHSSGVIAVVRETRADDAPLIHEAAASMPEATGASLETVTVTSSKIGGDVQNIPISITAMSQEQLTQTQTAGGPDLVKQVPNLTFTKTNFTGYNIQIRGIGTQAISVTTDPAVAVAFNDIPFIRNHFFEQEFFDVAQVEVLRGPQGTLYGRNATAGVVNLVSAKPTDQYEAMGSVDVGNYNNRRLEGMINIPIIGDKLGVRVAGEWTKRDGYSFNETTDKSVDGRDLWSGRATIGAKPFENLQIDAVWEHFQEDDDRVRSAKQLCKKDPGPTSVDGLDLTTLPAIPAAGGVEQSAYWRAFLSQGCLPTSLYSKDAFETPNGQAIPFVFANEFIFNGYGGGAPNGFLLNAIDPYASQTQSTNLRDIQSELSPTYRAKNDVVELNANYVVTPELSLVSQTAYNNDQLHSTEDFNRFDTQSGIFGLDPGSVYYSSISPDGVFCDPQLGCSTKMVGEDLSQERAWQFNQEVRLTSNFSGPLNFSAGANYLHYQTVEDYYIFFNLLTASVMLGNRSVPGDFTHCYPSNADEAIVIPDTPYYGSNGLAYQSNQNCYVGSGIPGTYIDPNPVSSLDGQGHNYFRSENPYRLNSLAGFGEAYYQVAPDVKLIGGLRWTDDQKRFWNIPSWVYLQGGGYPVQSIVNQEWKEVTGRFNVNWSPKLDFTDETLVYASYSRGYKGGGANPPGPQGAIISASSVIVHPPTFAPEFVNAFELGTKNTLLDGSMTLNGDVFYYDYRGYQISQIVDRTSINLNVDAKVKGAELEATWEPAPGLRFNLTGGLEDSSIDNGQSAIDLIDRTAGHTDWVVVKPFISDTSNCVMPASYMRQYINNRVYVDGTGEGLIDGLICELAYNPTLLPDPTLASTLLEARAGVPYDPSIAPNNGAGFAKDLGGNKLPNTPPFTLSIGAQYSTPLSADWAATLRADGYWQGNSFARIFNDEPYDQLHGYTNVNLALILTNQDGWQAMAYMKNVFNTTAITGAFLNSDDTALTTNVFLTDPRLFGLRITKNW